MNTLTSRSIEQVIEGVLTSDGAGVKLTRVLTGKLQRRLDPFLTSAATSRAITLQDFPITRIAASKP